MLDERSMTETEVSYSRRGEQLGWLIGWAGGFLWIIALALLFIVRGQFLMGLAGMALAGLGYGAVVLMRPWRHPHVRYWRLLLLPYLALAAALPWAIFGFGSEAAAQLSAWQALILLPLCSPFITIGWRRWVDGMPEGAQRQR